jgi:hypothetical protein
LLQSTVTFGYDARDRLIDEDRSGRNPYHFSYEYDKGGNRTSKLNVRSGNHTQRTCYHYDVDEPGQGSGTNRLLYAEVFSGSCDCGSCTNPLSTTWYYYNPAGNVTRVVTGNSSGGILSVDGADGAGTQTSSQSAPAFGGGLDQYTATRFEYAKNGEAVTYAMGESWSINPSDPSTVINPQILWAREFRYDSARARHPNRPLLTSENEGDRDGERDRRAGAIVDRDGV